MSGVQTRKTSRSRSCGRLPNRGPHLADSHSPESGLGSPACLSQPQVELPQQQTRAEGSSVSSRSKQKVQSLTVKSQEDNTVTVNKDPSTAKENSSNDNQTEKPSDKETSTIERVGDNRGNPDSLNEEADFSTESKLPPAKPTDPWFPVYQELREIRKTTEPIENIERSTALHTQQLAGVIERTSKLETTLGTATVRIRELDDEVSSLRSLVKQHEGTIASLKKIKEDLSKKSDQTITELNNMIHEQKKQMKAFEDQTQSFKKQVMSEMEAKVSDISEGSQRKIADLEHKISDVSSESQRKAAAVEGKVEKISDEVQYISLKSKANSNKLNLVITGLREDPTKSPLAAAKNFISSALKIKGVELDVAYRLGTAPEEGSTYIRPLVVRFPTVAHRDKVWKNKIDLTEEDGQKIRIHADLPKRLRDDAQLLFRVQKAASGIPKYKSAKIRDYKLLLNGEEYAPNELERLPEPLRPSTLATPKSDKAIVFFSRHSVFSNHYYSRFSIRGVTFSNVEQYLAYRKALFMDQDRLASNALNSDNPADAKSILNKLKSRTPTEWYQQVPEILAEGLREKFRQNQYIFEILISSRGLEIGEASRDTMWGVGMPLTDPQVLDVSKWHPKGNLLGRTLMKVREEFRAQASSQVSPSKSKNKSASRK